MIDPQLTNILPRRIVASLIDLGVVGLLSALVARSQAVSYAIGSRTQAGVPVWTSDQLAELRVIEADHINRQLTLGDTMWVWFGRGLVLSLLGLFVFSLVAWVLVPANTGWSAGHRIMGLRVVDRKGGKPPLDSYLRRYLVGILDLAPFVIPGLLGWFVASRNDRHQRIGDLSADTMVIDARQAWAGADPHLSAAPPKPVPETDLESMVSVEEAIETGPGLTSTEGPQSADQELHDSAPATAAVHPQELPVLKLEETPDIGHVSMADVDPTREILEIRDVPPTPDTGARDASEVIAGLEEVKPAADATEADEPVDADQSWHMPESEPAPVWTPQAGAASTAGQPGSGTTRTAPKPESPTHTATADASERAPMWNEEWQAWLFWDPKNNQWLRHDSDSGVWVPIEP